MTRRPDHLTEREFRGNSTPIRARKVDPSLVPLKPKKFKRTGWQILCEDKIMPLMPGEGIEVIIEKGVEFEKFLNRVRSQIRKYVQPFSSHRYKIALTTRRTVLVEVLE